MADQADVSQLETALRNADKAGDTVAATRLAGELAKRQAANAAPAEPPRRTIKDMFSGLHHEMIGADYAFAGLVPAGEELYKMARTGQAPTKYDAMIGAPGPYGATEQQAAKVEKGMQPIEQAYEMAARHPQVIGPAVKSAFQKEYAELLGMGGLDTPEQQEQWGKAATNTLMGIKGIYEVGAGFGKKLVDVFHEKEIAKLIEAQKSGNTAEVNKILSEKTASVKADAEAMKAAETSKSESVKKRLLDHRAQMAKNDIAFNKSQADLDKEIALSKASLNKDRTTELERIKAAESRARGQALAVEQNKIKELHAEHERVKANADREYQEALVAEQSLANSEKLNLSKSTQSDLRRKIDVYNRRVESNEAAVNAGLPQADGLGGIGAEKTPLNVKLVDAIETRINVEKARIQASPLYKNFNARVEELSNEGKVWGRDNAEGAKLLEKIRKEQKIKGSKIQDDLSTYKRNQYARLRRLLEHAPEKGKPVPVNAMEALNVVSELRKNSFMLQRGGNIRWKELTDMADEVENSLRSFVGEEHMPRKAWAELNANMNRLEQFEPGRIAAGRKEADFVPVHEQERIVPIENVEKEMFKNSTNIKSLRVLLRNDEEWYGMVEQHLSNELSGKTAAQAKEWLSKATWLDHIDDPSIRIKAEQSIANLQMREGNSVAAHESMKKIEDRLSNSEKELNNNIAKISERSAKFREESQQLRERLTKESAKKVVANEKEARAAGKEARLVAKETAGQEKSALAEALLPRTEALSNLRTQRATAAAEREVAKAGEKQTLQELKLQKMAAQQEIAASAENRKVLEKIGKDIDSAVFARSPLQSQRAFNRVSPQLMQSGIMTPEEVKQVETLLAEDVKAESYGRARNKARAKVKAIISRLSGSVAVGLGIGIPAYIGHDAAHPINEAIEAH